MPWWAWAMVVAGLTVQVGRAFAYEAAQVDPVRAEMHEYYRKQARESFSIFGSAPMGHVIPRRDHINLALGGESLDLAVVPPGFTVSDEKSQQKLSLKGWDLAPFVSFSGERFGIGFAAEGGYRRAEYAMRTSLWNGEGQPLTSTTFTRTGMAEFSGVGIYGYFMPMFRFLPKYVITNFVLGGKQIYVVHYTEAKGAGYGGASKKKYRYGIKKYDVGMDLGLELVKRFTILPWANYTFVKLEGAVNAADESQEVSDDILTADRDLLWESLPRLTYGIDFAVHVFRTDIHLGGFLGLVGNLFKGSDRIADNTISIGLSYEIK